MLEDTFEGLEDQEEMEEEAEAEIDKILFEITAGEFVSAAASQVLALFNKMQQLKSSSILHSPSGISSSGDGQRALTNWFLREYWLRKPAGLSGAELISLSCCLCSYVIEALTDLCLAVQWIVLTRWNLRDWLGIVNNETKK